MDSSLPGSSIHGIYNGILLSHKKERNAICNDMDVTRVSHTKSVRKTNTICYHLYVEFKI